MPKEIKEEIARQSGVGMTYEEWGNKSIEGEVCGILGCHNSPTSQCPDCKHWYCYEHVKIHFHKLNDDEMRKRNQNDDNLK